MHKLNQKFEKLKTLSAALRDDSSGLAVVEFALSLPFFATLALGGIESANYAVTVMKLNQITIHTADSAGRMGSGDQLAAKQVSELMINDVFSGIAREGESLLLNGNHAYTDPDDGTVALRGNALIVLSSIEETDPFNSASPRYRMRWQRCLGKAAFYTSNYGTPATVTSVEGVGPQGRVVTAPKNGATMFVETQYYYKPMALGAFGKIAEHTISQVAAAVVRDSRDLTQIYNQENVTPSTCHFN